MCLLLRLWFLGLSSAPNNFNKSYIYISCDDIDSDHILCYYHILRYDHYNFAECCGGFDRCALLLRSCGLSFCS